jgi:NADH dehydrogenase [ubiquinone] 1 alpha subcomplex assembly factor 5
MSGPVFLFDRRLLRQRRSRAAAHYAQHSALHDEIIALLLERLDDIKRAFSAKLVIGAPGLAAALAARDGFTVSADLSQAMIKGDMGVALDEEFFPFAAASFDLIVVGPVLHWVNDLPGALAQIRRALKPGGLFLAAFPGGGSLHELRACLLKAEIELTGGASARLSPTIDLQTASALLQRAGFQLPVTDGENVTLLYSDMFALMLDLRGMGEANALIDRPKQMARRGIFELADRLYRENYAGSADGIEAVFEIVFMHGWNEDPAAHNPNQ